MFENIFLAIIGIGLIGIISLLLDLKEIIHILVSLILNTKNWWTKTLPAQKVLGPLAFNDTKLAIFVRDFFIVNGTPLYSREGQGGSIGIVPNVLQLWPDVEGKSLAKILNLLGVVNKTKNIDVIEMSKDAGVWDSSIIILGAQTQKCFDFYTRMNEVAYGMNRQNIYNNLNQKIVPRALGFGYGIILKCKNPFVTGGKGIGFLLGGYGTLGTEAATYYFCNNISELGKKFGNKSFGVIIRASVSAGIQSTERLTKYDISFK